MKTLRIILADDQLLVRAGVRALLESLPGHEVIAECADGNQAIAEVRRQKPDITVLDIAMPGPSGIEVTKTIRQFDQTTRILILSSIDRHEVIEQAMAAGANGYLLKDFLLAELQLAVQTVSNSGCFLSPRVQETLNQPLPDGDHAGSTVLTVRQTEILRLVASGRTNKEIARDLEISPKTVEFHRAQLMERIGVHDVTGLTRYAMQYGLIT